MIYYSITPVPGDDIGFFVRHLRPATGGTPFLNLCQLVYDEDAFSLGSGGGFHDPHRVGIPAKLLVR